MFHYLLIYLQYVLLDTFEFGQFTDHVACSRSCMKAGYV